MKMKVKKGSFEWALMNMKQGKTVKCLNWNDYKIKIKNNEIVIKTHDGYGNFFKMTSENSFNKDLLGNDWELYKEPEKEYSCLDCDRCLKHRNGLFYCLGDDWKINGYTSYPYNVPYCPKRKHGLT